MRRSVRSGVATAMLLFVTAAAAVRAQETLQTFLVHGSEALHAGDNAAAERAFRRALDMRPSSVEILNDLAISLARQGKTAEAIGFYERALKFKPATRLRSGTWRWRSIGPGGTGKHGRCCDS